MIRWSSARGKIVAFDMTALVPEQSRKLVGRKFEQRGGYQDRVRTQDAGNGRPGHFTAHGEPRSGRQAIGRAIDRPSARRHRAAPPGRPHCLHEPRQRAEQGDRQCQAGEPCRQGGGSGDDRCGHVQDGRAARTRPTGSGPGGATPPAEEGRHHKSRPRRSATGTRAEPASARARINPTASAIRLA